MNTDTQTDNIGEAITEVVKLLVQYVDDVTIEHTELRASTVIALRVNLADHGRIIGEKGRTINLLQLLVETYGRLNGERTRLVALDPIKGDNEGLQRFAESKWSPEPAVEAFENLLNFFVAADVTCTDLGGKNLVFEIEVSEDDDKVADGDFRKEIAFLIEAVCKAQGRVCTVDFFSDDGDT